MIVVSAMLCLLLPFLYIHLMFQYKRRRLHTRTWDEVLLRVEPINIEALREIADSYLKPTSEQLRIEPRAMWEMLGGLDGISRLRSNAAALLDLAVYAERWSIGEGPVVSEMIRRDAVRLNKTITSIQLSVWFQIRYIRTPFQLQEAAASYYLIRSRLLGLYEKSHVGLLPRLAAAI